MEDTRRFRIPLKPVLALALAAGIAANLPVAWFVPQTPEARRAEVYSAFVALSGGAAEDTPFAFLDIVEGLSGQERARRQAQLAQVPPGLLRAYATQVNTEAGALRDAMLTRGVAHPFDVSAYRVQAPRFERTGRIGTWHWGLAQSGADSLAPEGATLEWCAQWLVFWDAELWYYAPVGTPALDALLAAEVPELGGVARAECKTAS